MTDKVKQLLAELGGEYKDIFPLNYIENIIDKDSKESLEVILGRVNHIYIPFTGEITITRLAVPAIMRRPGIKITYVNVNNEIVTESYIGNLPDAATNDFGLDANWETELNKRNINDVIKELLQGDLNRFLYEMVSILMQEYAESEPFKSFIKQILKNITSNYFTELGYTIEQVELRLTNLFNELSEEFKDKYDEFTKTTNNTISEFKNNVNNAITTHNQSVSNEINQHKLNTTNQVNNLQNQITNNDADITNLQTKVNGISYSLIKVSTLQYNLVDENNTVKGTINIPQDTFLDSANFDASTNNINFVFNTASGKASFSVNVSSLVDTYTNGNGLNLSNKQFSIKLDSSTEGYLKLTSNGIKISGIDSAIAVVQNDLNSYKTSNNAEIVSIKNEITSIKNKNNEQDTTLNSHSTSISDHATRIKNLEDNSGSGEDYSDEITALQTKNNEQDTTLINYGNRLTALEDVSSYSNIENITLTSAISFIKETITTHISTASTSEGKSEVTSTEFTMSDSGIAGMLNVAKKGKIINVVNSSGYNLYMYYPILYNITTDSLTFLAGNLSSVVHVCVKDENGGIKVTCRSLHNV